MTSTRTVFIGLLTILLTTTSETLDAQRPQSDLLSLHSLFGAKELAENVNEIRRRSAALPLDVQYEYLKSWILPSGAHPDFRVIGEFTPTDPSPLAIELEPHRFPTGSGGELVSPVFDLLVAASETGRLEELAAALEELPDPASSVQLRSKLVLQLLVAVESKNTVTLDRLAPDLYSKTSVTLKRKGVNYWPEMHLIAWAIDRRPRTRLVGTLLNDLYIQRNSIGMRPLWKNHIMAWMGKYETLLAARRDASTLSAAVPAGWIPVTRAHAGSRGQGYPPLSWRLESAPEILLHAGHDEDYLMYQSPLAGTFQVDSDLEDSAESQIQLLGRFVGPRAKGKKVTMGTFGGGQQILETSYPSGKRDKTVRYRAVVQDSNVFVFLNGRSVLGYAPWKRSEPWLALRSGAASRGHFHNVHISGNPVVPDSVSMSASHNLSDWIPYYLFSETAGTDESDWLWTVGDDEAGQIVGRRSDAAAGSGCESLLRYQRPLVEDGTIEYEFWYESGEYAAHPALDRLVFLIQPEGVRLHWLTDGNYDSTAVSALNLIDEPGNRLGQANLPLRSSAWNRMKLKIVRDVVLLELNGSLIYQRTLESTNSRTFGLFHYSDREDLLVRRAVMRAEWPGTIPSSQEQELSDPLLAVVDRDLDRLQARFTHDFTQDGLPEDYFKPIGPNAAQRLDSRTDGLHAFLTPTTQWNNLGIAPYFSLEGDFDVEVEFDQLRLSQTGTRSEIVLQAILEDEKQYWLRSLLGITEEGEENFNGAVTYFSNPEKRSFVGTRTGDGSVSGRLRIARRGTDFYSMMAQGDSPIYRIVKYESVPADNVKMQGLEIKLFLKDDGQASVVLKNLSIRAEKMTWLEGGNKRLRKLFAMSPDGTNLRELAEPKFDLTHLGSPEFSPDGSRIVMDMSTGSTTTSHIILMNRDGSDMKDLGLGCMPSLSKDGQSIVFSDPRAGIVKMDADGENRESIERSGWGVQFSPDGKYIAYGSYSNITLIDSATNQKTELFTGDLANRYSRVYWNFGWSHDSQAIAFKGSVRATGEQELAVVDLSKPDKVEVLYSGTGVYEDFTFSPDNQSVLFALRQEGPTQPDLYLAHRKTPGQIERLKGQPDDYHILDSDWSPDGKEIVFAALVDPQPVAWPPELNSKASRTESNPASSQ